MAESVLNKKSLGILGLFFLILVLSSCVTTEEKLYLNEQIVSLNNRVNSLQEAMDQRLSSGLDSRFQSISEKQDQTYSALDSVRNRQAENLAEMDRIRTQMQTLTGRVEENSHLVKRTVERDTTEQDEMKRSLAQLIQRFDKLEARVSHINNYLGLEPGGVVAKEGVEKPSKEAKPGTPPAPALEKEPVSPEKRLYELTLNLYRDGKYEEAIEGFENFLKKYPNSDLADNAQFWIGESYMSLRQYEQAILAYQGVIKKYPKGNKVPNAMLRQAQAFYEINDRISSKILLKKIMKTYPNSSEAKIAKARLDKM